MDSIACKKKELLAQKKVFNMNKSHTPESDAASLSHLLSLYEIQEERSGEI